MPACVETKRNRRIPDLKRFMLEHATRLAAHADIFARVAPEAQYAQEEMFRKLAKGWIKTAEKSGRKTRAFQTQPLFWRESTLGRKHSRGRWSDFNDSLNARKRCRRRSRFTRIPGQPRR